MSSRQLFLVLLGAIALAILLNRHPHAAAGPADDDADAKLVARIESLERLVKSQQSQLQDVSSLKSRLVRLERTAQSTRPSISSTIKSPTSDINQLKQESSSLRIALRRLESKITGFDQSNLQREVDQLNQKVSRLQSAVQRLESKR